MIIIVLCTNASEMIRSPKRGNSYELTRIKAPFCKSYIQLNAHKNHYFERSSYGMIAV